MTLCGAGSDFLDAERKKYRILFNHGVVSARRVPIYNDRGRFAPVTLFRTRECRTAPESRGIDDPDSGVSVAYSRPPTAADDHI